MRRLLWLSGPLAVLFAALTLLGAGTVDSANPHGELNLACSDCHSTEGWLPLLEPPSFHHASVGMPLVGAHADADCRSCHQDLVFAFVGTACDDCHRDAHAGELGFRCEACHDTNSWESQGRALEAHDRTLFPLFSSHSGLDCASCHEGQRPFEYATTPTECFGCHMTTFQEALEPNHVQAGFSMDCLNCHRRSSMAWNQAVFQHPATFALRGAHAAAACESCHANGFTSLPRDCASCHRRDFQAATSPNHSAGGFSMECQACHTEDGWRPASFRHELTAFALRGAHSTLDCSDCHAQGYAGTSTDCYACHRTDYQAARDPNHSAAGFPTSCQGCHSESAWRPASGFDHNTSRFPLQGAHTALDCSSCHAQGFAGTPFDCYSCHTADYQTTRDPNHSAAGFPTSCQTCHSQSAWTPASGFDHNTSRFPLRGAHSGLDCSSCHANGYAGTPTDCYSCHTADYQATRDPNHSAAGYPTSCETCHSQSAWRPATNVDHNQTGFPLTGAHRSLDCSACHSQGFSGTPTDCYACHRSDYQTTRDPNHSAAGFPTTCQTCHTTSRWEPSSWNHAVYFPIYSGEHRGEWDACSDCHVNPSNYAVFSCIDCHEHRRSEMDGEHRGVGGYQYESNACYSCHPTGRD